MEAERVDVQNGYFMLLRMRFNMRLVSEPTVVRVQPENSDLLNIIVVRNQEVCGQVTCHQANQPRTLPALQNVDRRR